jgi:dTDP-glucose 4,6-dehydratase
LKQLPTLSKRNILVTGGSGFIGSNFINFLLEKKNYQVFNIDDLTYASSNRIYQIKNSKNYRFFKKNICNSFATEEVIKKSKPNIIVHFAAESHVDNSIKNSDVFLKTNVFGTHTLLKSTLNYYQKLNERQKKEFLFIHISTDEVYGSLKNNEKAFTEKSQYRPNNPYSASKAAADHIVRAFHVTHQLPTITLHCSNNYGPNQHSEKFIPTIIRSALLNKKIPIYGKGSNIRDWINVRDFADAILKVINKGKVGEVYNVGGSCQISNLELVLKITAYLDKIQPSKTSYKNLISFVTDRKGHDFRYDIDISKIKRELKWNPQMKLDEGIKQTIRWYLFNTQRLKLSA